LEEKIVKISRQCTVSPATARRAIKSLRKRDAPVAWWLTTAQDSVKRATGKITKTDAKIKRKNEIS
jgi:hypothetical protein